MSYGACPGADELDLFLDEQLDLLRQAEVGTHVDACPACQSTLETLTGRRASDLFRLETESPCSLDAGGLIGGADEARGLAETPPLAPPLSRGGKKRRAVLSAQPEF